MSRDQRWTLGEGLMLRPFTFCSLDRLLGHGRRPPDFTRA